MARRRDVCVLMWVSRFYEAPLFGHLDFKLSVLFVLQARSVKLGISVYFGRPWKFLTRKEVAVSTITDSSS